MKEPEAVVEVDIRCAYCGLDHKIRVRLWNHGGKKIATAVALTEGCDVMDWTASIIERGNDANLST